MQDALDLVQEFYSLFAQGNVPGALDLLHLDVEWSETERSPYYAGAVRGAAAIVETVFAPITGDFDGFAGVPEEFVAQGDRVVVFGKYSGVAKVSGKALLVPFVHSWTVSEGKLARFVQYTDSTPWREVLTAS